MDTWAKPCPGRRSRRSWRAAALLALLCAGGAGASTDTLPSAALASEVDSVRIAAIRSVLGKATFAKFLLSLHDGDVHKTPSGRLVVSGEQDWSTGTAVVPLLDPVTG